MAEQHTQKKIDCTDLQNGPLENRECRDVLCLFLFIANVAAMAYCSYYAYYNGSLSNIFRGVDVDKNICGVGAAENYPYLYFTNVIDFGLTKRVCVKQCPDYYGGSLANIDCLVNSAIGSCNYDYAITQNGDNMSSVSPGSGGYDNIGYDSTVILDRLCFPSTKTFSYVTSAGASTVSSFQSLLQQGYLMNLVNDIKNNWQIFLGGIGIAIIISFIIMFLMKCIAGIVVWISIFGALFGLIGLGLLLMYSGGQFGSTNQLFMGVVVPTIGQNVQNIKYYGYAVLGIAGVFLLVILCMCNRIRLAVALCGCAGRYIVDVMTSVLVPIFMSFFTAALWAACIFCMLYLISAASFVALDGDIFTSFATYKDVALIRFYYFIFGTLWCNALIGAVGIFLIASSACMWYYSHGPGQDLHFPILRSLGRVFRYHFGSLAFGSLILAIIQFIQLVVQAIKQQLSKSGADKNKVVEYLLTCVQCYLACLQRVVAFLNKNAYIQIALRGKNFCMASKDGFEIVWSNPLRFAVVGGVGSIIMFIGKLLIASITTVIVWVIFSYSGWGTLISPVLPLIVVFVYSWAISMLFMSVYELAMDTLLVCFIVDESNQKEEGKNTPKYAPQQLLGLMD